MYKVLNWEQKHQDALWKEGKPVEAVRCSGQRSTGKPWILTFMWMLLWHVLYLGSVASTPLCKYSLMEVASFSRIMRPATRQKLFRNRLRNKTKSWSCWPALYIFQISIWSKIREMCWTKVLSMKAPPCELWGLKFPLIMFWYQIPQHTSEVLWSQSCFGGTRGTFSVLGGWFNVLINLCIQGVEELLIHRQHFIYTQMHQQMLRLMALDFITLVYTSIFILDLM